MNVGNMSVNKNSHSRLKRVYVVKYTIKYSLQHCATRIYVKIYLLPSVKKILPHIPTPFSKMLRMFLIKEPSGLLMLSTSNPNAVADIVSRVNPSYNL